MQIIALSGGKDSTAMALRLAEMEPDEPRQYIITPTGDELPPMIEHWKRIECLLDAELIRIPAPTLRELIDEQRCLPNWRMRWCTRMIKIEPCIEWLRTQPDDSVLCVGLRADEEARKGLYSDEITCRYPLREWGWGLTDVLGYLRSKDVEVPTRTDCARCFYQKLYEWYLLWRDYPEIYESAIEDEFITGHTFRSPSKDKHPASLIALRIKFKIGWIPKTRKSKNESRGGCRVCSM